MTSGPPVSATSMACMSIDFTVTTPCGLWSRRQRAPRPGVAVNNTGRARIVPACSKRTRRPSTGYSGPADEPWAKTEMCSRCCPLIQRRGSDVVTRDIDGAPAARQGGSSARSSLRLSTAQRQRLNDKGSMTRAQRHGKGVAGKMTEVKTVHEVTYDLLRSLGLTTVFGNPGSTEQTFLKNFPDDFTYILGLQEASVMAVADGFAQSTGKPALVNVHTAAGMGNAMGSLVAAYKGNTPLIVTAGQQTREMVLCEPYLTNKDENLLPLPWVKWAYQPARAEDVPAAFMRAYAVALQPPAGPVFLSIPLDDWDKPALGPAVVRTVSHRVAPDEARLFDFAER